MSRLRTAYGLVSVQGQILWGEISYLVFYSIQTFKGLDEAHPHGGGQLALLSLQIPMLPQLETPSQAYQDNVQ